MPHTSEVSSQKRKQKLVDQTGSSVDDQGLTKKRTAYRFDSREKVKINMRRWRANNRVKYLESKKVLRAKTKNERPWVSSYSSARNRCFCKASTHYRIYGGYGIKFNMTMDDFKFLWFRDKAYKMKKPSIDRIDIYGDYELSNCRYIEHSDNCKRPKRKF